jgi:NAD(P)-dependent dehydrogenase (short-subunit alcohol dehydrogenase family)
MVDQRILVVGASSGLGRAVATGLARDGAHVAFAARRAEMVTAAAAEAGNGSIGIACDVSDADACESVVAQAVEHLGGLDTLIFAAALGTMARIEETDASAWAEGFLTNVTGASLITRAALPHLEASSFGRAIYFSSMGGTFTPPWPGLGLYGVTKAALERMVESWSAEHRNISFTRLVVGPAAGDATAPSEFGRTWDADVAMALMPKWREMDHLASLVMPEDLTTAVSAILSVDADIPLLAIIPRGKKI